MINKSKAKEMMNEIIKGFSIGAFDTRVFRPDDAILIDRLFDQIYNSTAEEIDCEEEKLPRGEEFGIWMVDGRNQVKKQNKDFKERLLK